MLLAVLAIQEGLLFYSMVRGRTLEGVGEDLPRHAPIHALEAILAWLFAWVVGVGLAWVIVVEVHEFEVLGLVDVLDREDALALLVRRRRGLR